MMVTNEGLIVSKKEVMVVFALILRNVHILKYFKYRLPKKIIKIQPFFDFKFEFESMKFGTQNSNRNPMF